MTPINRRRTELTEQDKARHAEIRRREQPERPARSRQALAKKAERDTLIEAFKRLKAERERRGLSLADMSEASGIDRSNLSKLENDPFPNPTLGTLLRIAQAIGVRLTLGIEDQDAA